MVDEPRTPRAPRPPGAQPLKGDHERLARVDVHLLAARLRASFWFLPALVVLASMLAGIGLVEVDDMRGTDLSGWSPRLFGAGADGSRAMLSAIATSMVTVASVVFSMTMVTLSLTSTQYSPRVLRNFMRDRPTQLVLGVFLGVFAYCLVVLRTIRGGDEGAFIPSLAVLGGMAYALLGLAVLIYFIHHTALNIQAASIVQRIAADTSAAIDRNFPPDAQRAAGGEDSPQALDWAVVTAPRSGYVQAIRHEALCRVAGQIGGVVRVQAPAGSYVSQGGALLELGYRGTLDAGAAARAGACVTVARQRTVEQDPEFGLQQLVDIALRALSPGVNDPTTACMCLQALGTLLADLVRRPDPASALHVDGALRLVTSAVSFAHIARTTLGPVVRHARGDLDVLCVALATLEEVIAAAAPADRRQQLAPVVRELAAALSCVRPRQSAAALRRRLRALALAVREHPGDLAEHPRNGRVPAMVAPCAARPPPTAASPSASPVPPRAR